MATLERGHDGRVMGAAEKGEDENADGAHRWASQVQREIVAVREHVHRQGTDAGVEAVVVAYGEKVGSVERQVAESTANGAKAEVEEAPGEGPSNKNAGARECGEAAVAPAPSQEIGSDDGSTVSTVSTLGTDSAPLVSQSEMWASFPSAAAGPQTRARFGGGSLAVCHCCLL